MMFCIYFVISRNNFFDFADGHISFEEFYDFWSKTTPSVQNFINSLKYDSEQATYSVCVF